MIRSVFDAARAHPDALALVSAKESQTYSELAASVARRAGALAALGLLDQNRTLALVLRPTRAGIETLLACFAFGVPVLVLHPKFPEAEARDLEERARACARIDPETLTFEALEPNSRQEQSWTPEPPVELDAHNPLVLVPTSGSTGKRKIVILSRRAFEASARASARNIPLAPGDRWLLCLPLAHVGGLSILTRSVAAMSAVVLFEPAARGLLAAAPALARALEEERIQFVSLVPAVLDALLDHDKAWTPPCTLRAVLLGGAATSSGLLERAHARGVPVLPTYGLTEACSQVTTTPLGDKPSIWNGLVSSGRPLAEIEIAVDSKRRIRVRGPTLCSGYLDTDAEFDDNGWFTTDDIGRFGPNGELYVLGRASERLVSGGENVDPALVEAALLRLPGVGAACVFGVPDPRFGEIVACAIVTTPEGFDPHRSFVSLSERLATHERPRRLALLDQLPLNLSGKVDRIAVRELAIPRLRAWAR